MLGTLAVVVVFGGGTDDDAPGGMLLSRRVGTGILTPGDSEAGRFTDDARLRVTAGSNDAGDPRRVVTAGSDAADDALDRSVIRDVGCADGLRCLITSV